MTEPRCCAYHNQHCEPPSELCCNNCTEINHGTPHHDLATCVLGPDPTYYSAACSTRNHNMCDGTVESLKFISGINHNCICTCHSDRNPTYEDELTALTKVLDGKQAVAQTMLRHLNMEQLNKLADAADTLAVLVDQEMIRRIPKRTHLSE